MQETEQLEQLISIGFLDADACVVHANHYYLALVCFILPVHPDLDVDTALLSELDSVGLQTQQHLRKSLLIGLNINRLS